MRLTKWCIKTCLGLVCLALCPTSEVSAQSSYPTRSIQLIVPFPAGGPTDLVGRRIGDKLQQSFGKPVVVENRPGGGTLIGAEAVIRSDPDGYTLLCASVSTFAITPSLYKKRNYNPRATLVPVVIATETPMVLAVNPNLGINSIADLIAYAKRNPGKLAFASVGAGSSPHLLGEMLKSAASIDIQHVPYKGSAPAINDLVGGHVGLMFDQMGVIAPLANAGQVKVLAISSTERYPVMPDVPTMKELGYPVLSRTAWTAFAAPAGTPAQVVQLLNREINKALQDPDLKNSLEQTGVFIVGGSAERFGEIWDSDEAFWREAIAKSGVELE